MKPVINPIVMKEVNTSIIRNILRSERQATKQRLAELSGLSTVTVGTILNQMAANNEVFETNLIPSCGGRPAQNYCYNGEFSHVVILYTHVLEGNDTIFTRVINLFGECVYEENYSPYSILPESFEPIIDKAIEAYPTVKAIGFGLPGVEHEGIIRMNNYESLKNMHFIEYYKEKYGIPVLVENDVNLAVSGYCHSHLNEDERTVVYIYFPRKYEPGSGIFINGAIYKGMNNFAGEIKKLPLEIDWKTLDYFDFGLVCDAISRLIVSFTCILNPDKVVLYGDFITDEHLSAIKRNCRKDIEELFMPKIRLSEDFDLDFEMGLNICTLKLILPVR